MRKLGSVPGHGSPFSHSWEDVESGPPQADAPDPVGTAEPIQFAMIERPNGNDLRFRPPRGTRFHGRRLV
ncbi:hypothetical protein GCM10028775_80850 [Catellatospora paridis]